jgi:hypothetical protein
VSDLLIRKVAGRGRWPMGRSARTRGSAVGWRRCQAGRREADGNEEAVSDVPVDGGAGTTR